MELNETQYRRIRGLIEQLHLPFHTRLLINKETGAGYICIGSTCASDTVLARWTSYNEGITLLNAYLDAHLRYPNP